MSGDGGIGAAAVRRTGSAAATTTLALGALWTLVAGALNVVGVQLAHRGHSVGS
ncbi:MAG: hypothetical protein HOQ18_08935 [Dermatophilaceae bacterium]|nr:hypothetical protein [Dermatophilaceae bacterium]